MGSAFEWDEDKRLSTMEKHGIDFRDAQLLFDGRPVLTRSSSRQGESRSTSTDFIGEKFYTVIWTVRESTIRLISARRARDAEERKYREVYGERAG